MNGSCDVRVVCLGLLSAGVRTSRAAGRVACIPADVALRAPLIGAPLRQAATRLAGDGEETVADARARLAPLVANVLGAPEVGRAIDHILEGPLTDAVARAIGEHHVVERLAAQLLEEAELERIIDAVLEDPRTERLLVRVLESRLLDELTGVVLESPEMRRRGAHDLLARTVVLYDGETASGSDAWAADAEIEHRPSRTARIV